MAFTIYGIGVSAATRIGEGAGTNMFVTTPPDIASPPSFVSTKTLNSTAIELSCGYPEIPRGSIDGYIIYHNNRIFSVIILPFMDDIRNQSRIFSGLIPFTYYEFTVAAFSATFVGIRSVPVVARTDEYCKML